MKKNIMYLNGKYILEQDAKIDFLDRGFQFCDGLYEGISIHLGSPVKLDEHLNRLHRSLEIIKIPLPSTNYDFYKEIIKNLMLSNNIHPGGIEDGYIYLQVTRGITARKRVCAADIPPTTIVTVQPCNYPIRYDPFKKEYLGNIGGIKAISVNNQRWQRSDIKSLMLLPSVLASFKASEAGADEAIIIKDNGEICEGTVSNVFIIDEYGIIRTHPEDFNILPGIVRKFIKEYALEHKLRFEERAFTLEEALRAKEMFLTSTKNTILPVTVLNNQQIKDGKCGIYTKIFLSAYWGKVYSGEWFDLKPVRVKTIIHN